MASESAVTFGMNSQNTTFISNKFLPKFGHKISKTASNDPKMMKKQIEKCLANDQNLLLSKMK